MSIRLLVPHIEKIGNIGTLLAEAKKGIDEIQSDV